jgi:hypothetical protein
MNKKQAIKKLSSVYPNYSIQVDAAATGNNTTQGAKAVLQILEKTETGKAPVVLKYSTSYGVGASLSEAQDNAIVNAISNLGI